MSEVSSQTLHLVARELNTELNDARAALEAFGEQAEDVALLNKCREHLRQVNGALRVVEVYGAALLTEEMEQLARYLVDNFAERRHLAEGLDALMRAMVQLPTYLERVLSGGRDMALVLLPLLNDLRAVRGHALLSEGTLLLLNLSSDKQANPVAPSPGEPVLSASQWARKMRTRFQLGLLGWIKGERIDQNLEILARSAEKLEQIATTQPVFQLWWVVGALLEALKDKGLEGSASVKRLLGQADREMRRLYEQGESHYVDNPPLELLNNLLYYIARATAAGPRVSAVRASFRLGELLPVDEQVEAARESLSAPSVKLMKTVAAAIKEDLGRVKDALDIFVRKGGTQPDELAPQLEMLRKIGDTLGVLGLGELRDKVQTETADLQAMIAARGPADDAMLLRMAGTLISVEDSLDEQLVGLIRPVASGAASGGAEQDVEFRQVAEAVLRECIVNMARIKEAIALAIERPREAQALDQVPQLVRGITAGLLMLGKSRAVEVTENIGKALARYARTDGVTIASERMDRLADAIVAVEYYLETVQAGRSDPWYMLDNAESCLKALADMSTGATSIVQLREVVAEPQRTIAIPRPPEAAAIEDADRTEVLQEPAARTAPPPAASTLPPVLVPPPDKADPEFLELFIEEARDEIVKQARLLPLWDENPQDVDALVNLRRSFHTLKGSGRMVGAQLIGEFAWSIENLLNRVINKTLDRTPDIVALLRQAVAAVPELVEQLETGRTPNIDVGPVIEQACAIAGTRPPHSQVVAPAPSASAATAAVAQTAAAAIPAGRVTAMDPVLHEIYAKETAGHLAVIREFIAACEVAAPPFPVTEALHRSCHTLSGTAKTAGARQGIKVAEPLNHYVRKLYDNGAGLPAAGLAVLKDAVAAIENIVANINENTSFFASQSDIVARIEELEQALDSELSSVNVAGDATIVTPVAPLMDPEDLGAELTSEAAASTFVSDKVPPLDADLIEVEDLWQLAQEPVAAAAPPLPEQIAPAIQEDEDVVPAAMNEDLSLSELGEQALAEQLNETEIGAGGIEVEETPAEPMFMDEEAGEASEPVAADAPPVPDVVVETAAWAAHFEPPVLQDEVAVPMDSPAMVQVAASPSPNSPPAAVPVLSDVQDIQEDSDAEFDADVAAIFTEEATELLESADASLTSWSRDRSNKAQAFELKRALHTLKGGARMAGIRAMGDLSHELESFMQLVEDGLVPADQPVFDALQASLDELHRMRDTVSQGRRVAPARELMSRIQALSGRGSAPTPESIPVAPEPAMPMQPESPAPAMTAPVQELEVEFHAEELAAVAPATVSPSVTEPESGQQVSIPLLEEVAPPLEGATLDVAALPPELAPDVVPETPAAAVEAPAVVLPPGREPQQQERGDVARVDAELLDTLLNNAGEVSIFRSRLEQQVTSIEFNLAELGRTVTRLKEQLRKMELETEAQVLHKHQDDSKGREDFDPLELDRYSTIQQLSRALAESVSDVGSIEGLLENLTREAQNLLLQQSRVVTELQNGLMRTRMVPFSRHVQRLSRLVRQVATDTGKRAELVVAGASGELDRQVLERMLPPFEHMLRNSVVHGIESPEQRTAAGKPESGTIKVGLHREGAEMVIVVEDDGRGIDVQAVRERARARGLLQPGRILTDEEALQLVLEPGFSTASAVTQHAGRGVGMDVVVNEIKKLGGALFTQSTPGHGTRFTIRLPFTLAISQALIVRVGDDELYALPLPTVEGVARVPRSEVMTHLTEDVPTFSYGGQVYRFQHLGAFIGAGPSALPETDVPVAVVLVRAGEHSTALVTDELVGNREIVVKSVGPQVASIRGISGATILGDGRVVIILDMGALVRSEWRARPADAVRSEDRRTFALVVDDSITVRRVTQRLLERNGMRVMTAKDGVDAMSILQDHVPDVILLDIEMPRMDGYELASHVRGEPRLAGIPIVMITSRVGEKHRARAIELGVNDYLGKPYQENQLLDAIEPLVEARRRQVS